MKYNILEMVLSYPTAHLDVNSIGKFKDTADEDMKPVWNWLDRQNGKIVYASTKKFEEEWERAGGIQLGRELQRRNKLKEIPVLSRE